MDIAWYRRAETLAAQNVDNWRHTQAQYPETFATVRFPIRVESVADLLKIADSMQDGRFDYYQAEIGGLTPAEAHVLANALASFARFFQRTFHTRRFLLPFDTMLSAYVLSLKVGAWCAKEVLEIGPGCGYFGFFLTPGMRYTQIEVTESFYVLQSLVNDHLFGERHAERAVEATITGCVPPAEPAIIHLPWWRIEDAAEQQYDVVMCNAALNEMSQEAMQGYVALAAKTLRPDGVFIAQGWGGGSLSTPSIANAFNDAGLSWISYDKDPPVEIPTAVFGRHDVIRPPWDRSGGRPYTKAEIAELVTQRLRSSP